MNRKTMPLVLMLSAGAVSCIITFVRDFPVLNKLLALLISMVVFYLLGNVMKWTLDAFDRQNEEKLANEGDVLEKEADGEAADEKQE